MGNAYKILATKCQWNRLLERKNRWDNVFKIDIMNILVVLGIID
jgi:hypothetical protein